MKKWKMALVLTIAVTVIVLVVLLLPADAVREGSRTIRCFGRIRYP